MNEKIADFCSIITSMETGGEEIIFLQLLLVLMPYEKFLEIFPAARSKIMIKVLGGFFLIFGSGHILLARIV